MMVDLVNILSSALNFTVREIQPSDGAFGSQNPDGSFSGIVGVLQREEADFTNQLMSMNQ